MEFVECVSFILIRNGQVLLEKRRDNKRFDPGMVMIPGGHMDNDESQTDTLIREVKEELNVVANRIGYVCSLIHTAKSDTDHEIQRLHYYLVTEWQGKIEAVEAESVFWQPLDQLELLTIQSDQLALAEAVRLYSL